jgi:hypothetical protein
MKQLIALIGIAFASATFAADAQLAKQPDPAKIAAKETKKVEKKKEEKVKSPPSATKPTPKKKAEEKK